MDKKEERYVLNANSLKRCNTCKLIKKHHEFHNNKRNWDRLQSNCKSCFKTYRETYYEANKDKIKDKMKSYRETNKHKIRAINKSYQEANKDKLKSYNKAYQEANKDKIKSQRKAYYEKNKDEILARQVIYERKRKESNPLFRLAKNVRYLIRASIKNGGYHKKTKTAKILGCSFEEFSNWLDFDRWINEDCHIDHVIPVSLAETKEDILLLNHYSNLQVLSAEENIKKGNRFILKSNLQRVLDNHPKEELVRNIISRNNILIK